MVNSHMKGEAVDIVPPGLFDLEEISGTCCWRSGIGT